MNILNAESAADSGVLDRLNCFVHGDAIAMEMTSRFDRAKRRRFQGYKPLVGRWFPKGTADRLRSWEKPACFC
jgi:hypothetical protein